MYVLYVVEIFAWPSHLLTTLIGTPAFSVRVAKVCLSSWKRKAEYAIMQTGYGFAVACFALEGEDCAWHEKAGSVRL